MIRTNLNDKLEIRIKQAPISKIAIYNDRIELIKGKVNPEVFERFDISDDNFKKRFVSFPMYIKNVLESKDKSLYYLEGLSSNNRLPIPDDKIYEDYDLEKYLKVHGGEYEGNVICLIQQLINPTMLIEFYQKQHNYHSDYQIKMGTILFAKLIVNFNKEDCIYTDIHGNVTDYGSINNNKKMRDNLVQAIKNSKLVSVQKETNTIVTKTVDE